MSAFSVQPRVLAGPLPEPSPFDSSAPFDQWSPVQQTPQPQPGPIDDPGAPPWTPYPPTEPGQGPDLPPGAPPKVPSPPGSEQPGHELPSTPPPNVPPPGSHMPAPGPGKPPVPTEPPTGPGEPGQPGPLPEPPPKGDDGFNWKPVLIGIGAAGLAGAAAIGGVLAYRTGARNIRALEATGAAFGSGAMHQGGLQAVRDAGVGARLANGISFGDRLAVATPIVNRIGENGRLVSVARGHLDHAELLASSTALRRGADDAVSVHEPLRRHVLAELEGGRALPSVLDDLDRSAAGAKPVFDNPQLGRYWNRTSIVERGSGRDVTSGVDAIRPELALREGSDGLREIVETGRDTRLNQLVAARGADLDGRGLASGIGTIQGVGVSRLNPEMQRSAIAASGVDPQLVETIGLNGAFTQRWSDRLAAGVASPS